MATANRSTETPTPTGEAPDTVESALRALRRFHRLGRSAAPGLATPGPGVLPALLHPYREPDRVRDDSPLLLFPDADPEGRTHLGLTEAIEAGLDAIAPGAGEARFLRDNRHRIERSLRARAATGTDLDARAELIDAATEAGRVLGLADEHARTLVADATRLGDRWPEGTVLIGDRPDLALRVFVHLASIRGRDRRATLVADARRVAGLLDDLLRLDRGKQTDARTGSGLGQGMGRIGARFLDPDTLSSTLGEWRGSEAMPAARRARIESIVADLRAFIDDDRAPTLTVVAREPIPASGPDVRVLDDPHPLDEAVRCLDRASAALTDVFRALHRGRMELDGVYDPARHDAWLEAYGWTSFSAEERALLPPVVAIETEARLATGGLDALSRALRSGRPVHLFVDVVPVPGPDPDEVEHGRLELGYLAIGHRDVLVHQSSAARPEHLVAGFERSLASARPSLHLLASGVHGDGSDPVVGRWLHVGAAIEARAHPLFLYDPDAGSTWARRLDFSGNPAPDADWPTGSAPDPALDGAAPELAFTWADLALLEPGYRTSFALLPDVDGLDAADDLVPLADVLASEPADAVHRIPVVTGVDADGRRLTLAVTDRIVAACRDRLDFWRTLQELAGVRNAYVTEATERVRTEMNETLAEERTRLATERDQAVAEARDGAARDAMGALARMLLDLDPGGAALALGVGAPAAAAPATPAPAASAPVETVEDPSLAEPPAEAEAPAADDDEDDGGFDDPWIDTPRCTSCNDCMNVNALTFVYDENKQARIGDASAATFEELVRAAELCPAKCIHPGKPKNPDEPNLEDLLRRAAPFNG